MRIDGISLQEGSSISNLTVASGTVFPASPNAGELFYRSDADDNIVGMYIFVDGVWERISSAKGSTIPSGETLPSNAVIGDLFYKIGTGIYVFSGTAWNTVTSAAVTINQNITGDVSGSLTSSGGSLSLADSGVTPGTYGSATSVPVISTDSKGRITAVSEQAFSLPTLSDSGTGSFVKITRGSNGLVTGTAPVTAADLTSVVSSEYVSKTQPLQEMAGPLSIGWQAYDKIQLQLGGNTVAGKANYGLSSTVTVAFGGYDFNNVYSRPDVAAGITAAQVVHFRAAPITLGSGASVTSQYGFAVDSNVASQTPFNVGFFSSMAASATPATKLNYAFYSSGSAQSMLAGQLTLGTSAYLEDTPATTGALVLRGLNDNSTNMNIVRYSGDAVGSKITFFKSHSATHGQRTLLVSQDEIGTISFAAPTTTGWLENAKIVGRAASTHTATSAPSDLTFYTTNVESLTPAARFRIRYSGGWGTDSSGFDPGISGQVLTSTGDSSPTWTTQTVTWPNVTNKPTTVAGFGIANAYTKTEVDSLLTTKAGGATTLAGYGITDAHPLNGSTSLDFAAKNVTVAGAILPTVTNTYDIGSSTLRFNKIYVNEAMLSVNTLYLGDTAVMGTTANTVIIKADPNQSIAINTTGTGTTTLTSAASTTISTTGMNADVVVQASGAGSKVRFTATNSVELSGDSVSLTGTSVVTNGSHSVTGNLTVGGNLTINGTQTVINATTVTTKDNILVVNFGEVGSGVTSGKAGIQVDRGDLTDYQIIFDEADDMFKVGQIGDLQTIASQNYVLSVAAPVAHVGSNGTSHAVVTTNTAGFMSATDKVKLDGITAGATAYSHPTSGVTAGTYKSLTVDANGHVTAGTNPTTLAGFGITDAQALDADLTAIAALAGTSGILKKTAANTWALDTSVYLTGNQTVTVSGDATGSGSTTIALTLASTGVTAGTYGSATGSSTVTIDAKGRVTSASTTPIALAASQITSGAFAAARLPVVSNAGTGSFLKLTTDTYGRVTGTTAVVASDITSLVDSSYVNIAGDSMTGALNITTDVASTAPALNVFNQGSGTGLQVVGGGTGALFSVIRFETPKLIIDSTGATLIQQSVNDGSGAALQVGGTVKASGLATANSIVNSASTTTTAVNVTSVASFSATVFRGGWYKVAISSGTSYHITQLSVVHDGTTATMNESGTIKTGSALGTFSADINAGSVRILFTPASATSTTVKLEQTLINI